MEKLMALIAEIAEDEEVVVLCQTVTRHGEGLSIGLEIETEGWGEERRRFEVHVDKVLSYAIRSEAGYSLRLTNNHPVLWQFQQDSASAYLRGVPVDAFAAVGALYQAHQYAVDDWFSLDSCLNKNVETPKLLGEGHGLLGQGPVSLLETYRDALAPHGIEVEILSRIPPGGWRNPADLQDRLWNEAQALLFGDSYVVGMGWSLQAGS